MARSLGEIHPGEILFEDFMEPMGITANELAVAINVPIVQIGELVQGRYPITPAIALCLGGYFKMDPGFWINLQTEYDMRAQDKR